MALTRAERAVRSAALWVLLAAVTFLVWPVTFGGATSFVGVDGRSMDGTYATGDLIVLREQPAYAVGDIVTFRVPAGEFGAGAHVIHRIVGGDGTTGFITQGDNKPLIDPWRPKTSDVVGKSWVRVPGAAARFQQLGQPVPLGALCAGLTVFVMLLPKKQTDDSEPTPVRV